MTRKGYDLLKKIKNKSKEGAAIKSLWKSSILPITLVIICYEQMFNFHGVPMGDDEFVVPFKDSVFLQKLFRCSQRQVWTCNCTATQWNDQYDHCSTPYSQSKLFHHPYSRCWCKKHWHGAVGLFWSAFLFFVAYCSEVYSAALLTGKCARLGPLMSKKNANMIFLGADFEFLNGWTRQIPPLHIYLLLL